MRNTKKREIFYYCPTVILRIVLLCVSATYMPFPLTTTPIGKLKVADEAGPSAAPLAPVPAKVVTVPLAEILRITLLYVSATYMLLPESNVHPSGKLKVALEAGPLVKPFVPVPAKVLTMPEETVILRMQLFWISVT